MKPGRYEGKCHQCGRRRKDLQRSPDGKGLCPWCFEDQAWFSGATVGKTYYYDDYHRKKA